MNVQITFGALLISVGFACVHVNRKTAAKILELYRRQQWRVAELTCVVVGACRGAVDIAFFCIIALDMLEPICELHKLWLWHACLRNVHYDGHLQID